MSEIKICTKCKEAKPVTEFYICKSEKYHSWCKDCCRASATDYAQLHDRKAYAKAYKQSPKYKAYDKDRKQSNEYKNYIKAYRQLPKYKAYMKDYNKAYRQSDEYKSNAKDYMKSYRQSPEYKTYMKAFQQSPGRKDYMKAYWKSQDGRAARARCDVKRKTLMKSLPCDLTAEQWEEIKADQNYKCAFCGEIKPLHRDHIVPLSKGGAFTKNNIQGLCKSCNSRKSNKIIEGVIEQEL